MIADIQAAIRSGRYYLGPHAGLRQLEHDITVSDLEEAIGGHAAQVIEDYPADPRGHSTLVRGMTNSGAILHAVLTFEGDELFVVTCYRPDPAIWYPEYRKRRPT